MCSWQRLRGSFWRRAVPVCSIVVQRSPAGSPALVPLLPNPLFLFGPSAPALQSKLGAAEVPTHKAEFPEVVWGEGKTPSQLAAALQVGCHGRGWAGLACTRHHRAVAPAQASA